MPDEVIVDRVVGRRLDPETGDIYHMTFKPPPADIVDRLKQVRCASGASVDAASLLDVMHLCSACVLKVLKRCATLQRDDDTEEKVMTRIQVYKDNIKPIQELYQEEIVAVDGNVGMDAVFLQIESALDQWATVKAA